MNTTRDTVGQPSSLQNDAASHDKLDERAVIPTFYQDRNRFVEMMRHCIALNGSFFNTHRMIQQYVSQSLFWLSIGKIGLLNLNNHPHHEVTTNKPSHQAAHDCPMGVGNSRHGRSCATRQLRHDRCSQKTGSPRLSSMQDGQSHECFQPTRRRLSRISPKPLWRQLRCDDLRASL